MWGGLDSNRAEGLVHFNASLGQTRQRRADTYPTLRRVESSAKTPCGNTFRVFTKPCSMYPPSAIVDTAPTRDHHHQLSHVLIGFQTCQPPNVMPPAVTCPYRVSNISAIRCNAISRQYVLLGHQQCQPPNVMPSAPPVFFMPSSAHAHAIQCQVSLLSAKHVSWPDINHISNPSLV